jgi:hypothetical protein
MGRVGEYVEGAEVQAVREAMEHDQEHHSGLRRLMLQDLLNEALEQEQQPEPVCLVKPSVLSPVAKSPRNLNATHSWPPWDSVKAPEEPLRFRAFVASTVISRTPQDVALAELAVELFYPVDEPSEALVRSAASS